MNQPVTLARNVNPIRWGALAVGTIGAALCLLGLLLPADRDYFFRAYLFAWIVCLSLALGGMSLVMIHNLTGGEWGRIIRRCSESAAITLPLLLLMFIPIVFGLPRLFPWANPGEVAASDVWQHRRPYLNEPFFIVRSFAYLIIWCVIAILLWRWQRRWELTGDVRFMARIRALSAGGLILYVLTMTNAGVDWLVSRDEHFYSTAFGLILTIGQTLFSTAFAVAIIGGFTAKSERESILARMTSRGVRNDIGNILMVMVILWTYVTFMQFLVIWMGNSQDDNGWYVQRGFSQPGAWRWIGLFLILFHFFIPFFILLFRGAKQYGRALVTIAWVLLFSHLVEQYWLVAPSGHGRMPRFDLHWLDLAAPAALGGIWLFAFLTLLPREWVPAPIPLPEPPGKGVPAGE